MSRLAHFVISVIHWSEMSAWYATVEEREVGSSQETQVLAEFPLLSMALPG